MTKFTILIEGEAADHVASAAELTAADGVVRRLQEQGCSVAHAELDFGGATRDLRPGAQPAPANVPAPAPSGDGQ